MTKYCNKCGKKLHLWETVSYETQSTVLKNGDVYIWKEIYHKKCVKKDDKNSNTPLIDA